MNVRKIWNFVTDVTIKGFNEEFTSDAEFSAMADEFTKLMDKFGSSWAKYAVLAITNNGYKIRLFKKITNARNFHLQCLGHYRFYPVWDPSVTNENSVKDESAEEFVIRQRDWVNQNPMGLSEYATFEVIKIG